MGDDDEVKDGTPGPKRPRASRTPRAQSSKTGSEAVAKEEPKELAVRSRSMFLRDVEQQLARRELYNLDDEFAKTKKNRSPVVALSVGLFVVIMVGIGIAVTTYIQQRSQNVPVNISAFQDVNLMSLLDRAKQITDKLNTAEQNLQNLQSEESNAVAAVASNESQQIQLIDNQLISSAEKRTRAAAVRSQAQSQINQIHAKYAEPIKKQEQEVKTLQNQAAQYDTRQVQQAKKQEAVLNNQQRLFDLQMKKTEDFYKNKIAALDNQYKTQIASIEQHNQRFISLLKRNHATEIANLIAKYNPTFTAPELVSLLNEPVQSDPITGVAEDPFVKTALRAGAVDSTSVTNLVTRVGNFSTLLGALQKVPYENSVPPALSHLRYFNAQIITDYRAVGKGMQVIVDRKDNEIAQLQQQVKYADSVIGEYNHALHVLVTDSRENGYVLDPTNPSKIAVFIDPLYHVQTGDTAYVFRKDDQQIGTIRFTVSSNGTITAQETSLVKKDVHMRAFDKILLNLK